MKVANVLVRGPGARDVQVLPVGLPATDDDVGAVHGGTLRLVHVRAVREVEHGGGGRRGDVKLAGPWLGR